MVSAATITPGNLVIYRVGTGAAALGLTATPVFLDEYTPAGVVVQSIPVSSTGAGALTAVGTSATEGILTRSSDGNSIVLTGYRKDAGGTNPSADNATLTNRVIGTLDISGVINTSIGITDVGTAVPRSAATTDGSIFYAGTSTGIRYVGTPSGSATSVVIDTRNSREVQLSGGNLIASNGSTAITGKVQSYGPLPTATTAANPLVSLGTADAVNGFVMFDLDAGVAGDDTLYALSTVSNTVVKYSFDGSTWLANGTIPASGTVNLTGAANGSTVNLFLTSGSSLYAYSDTSGYNTALTGTLGTAIATAGTNTAFRGIAQFAIPEPGAGLLGLLGLTTFLRRRRR